MMHAVRRAAEALNIDNDQRHARLEQPHRTEIYAN